MREVLIGGGRVGRPAGRVGNEDLANRFEVVTGGDSEGMALALRAESCAARTSFCEWSRRLAAQVSVWARTDPKVGVDARLPACRR